MDGAGAGSLGMAFAAADAADGACARAGAAYSIPPLSIEPAEGESAAAVAANMRLPAVELALPVDFGTAPRLRRSDRPLLLAGLLAASIAHSAVIYVMTHSSPDAFGSGGQELEAINVEIVTASALESRAAEAGAAAAAVADVSDSAGSDSASAVAAQPSERREEKKPEQEAATEVAALPPDTVAESPPDAIATASPEKPKEAPREEPPKREEKPEPKDEAQEPSPQQAAEAASAATAQGGASARGTDDTAQAASAAAAASPGVVRDYAKAVVNALSKAKPKAPGGGALGTVKVSFVIGREGEVAELRITKSSGRDALDNAALDAVRRARFPAPPAGLTTAQLTYEVPYHFR